MQEQKMCMRGKSFQLYLTKEQKETIERFFDIYRHIYNWGIQKQRERYEAKLRGEAKYNYTFYDLGKMLAQYRQLPGNEWLLELPFNSSKLALRDVCHNYKRFFDGFSKHTPGFKSKDEPTQMFRTRHNRFYIEGNQIRFEGLKRYSTGPGAKVETIRIGKNTGAHRTDDIVYHNPSIHRDNLGRYWVSYVVEEPVTPLDKPKTEAIGVDVGIRRTMTLSTGEIFTRPKEKIAKLTKRLKRCQRHIARDNKRRAQEAAAKHVDFHEVPVSKRSAKRSIKTKKLFRRITNIKHNFYHETIKSIVLRNPEVIGIETIYVKRMMRKRRGKRFNSQIATADFFTMREIFEVKCEKYGVPLVEADPEFPSSNICSNCGHSHKMHSQHIYKCPNCGIRIDRDINAALNLRDLALGKI